MSASTPPGGVQLKPGVPANLPITVRNNGGSKSEPVAVSLNLPDGVRAIPAAGGGAVGANGFRQQGPATIAVSCPGGTGTVTCRTGTGLEPGQSAVLTFRLLADETAKDGSLVTGSVTAGAQLNVRVEVQVKVPAPPKPPEPRDDLALSASSDWMSAFPWHHNPRVNIRVKNTGESTKPVTITLDHRMLYSSSFFGIRCTPTGEGTSCTSRGSLAPGREANLTVTLKGRPPAHVPVTVNATLGSAKAKPVEVYFGCWHHHCDDNALLPSTTVPSLPSVTSKPSGAPDTTKPGRPGWPTPSRKPSPSVTPSEPPKPEPSQPGTTTTTTTTSAPPKPGKSKPTTRPNGEIDRIFQ